MAGCGRAEEGRLERVEEHAGFAGHERAHGPGRDGQGIGGQDGLQFIGETPRPSLAQLVAWTYPPKAPDSS